MDTLAFISRYEAILKERKIKKMEFYKMCGISDAAVSQWRKGKTNPTMATIKKIADVLEVSSNYLLTGIDEQKEKPTAQSVGLSEKDIRVINWFRSLPEEKRQAILMLGGAPEDLLDSEDHLQD